MKVFESFKPAIIEFWANIDNAKSLAFNDTEREIVGFQNSVFWFDALVANNGFSHEIHLLQIIEASTQQFLQAQVLVEQSSFQTLNTR